MQGTDVYRSPLCERYASAQMQHLFSDDVKFSTWRKLWVALAEAEMELGIPISQEQIDEMRAHVEDIDYASAAAHEARVRHDVMAHVLAFGEQCPKAKPIIHLGATSSYVGDNTDLMRMREALGIIRALLVCAMRETAAFARAYKDVPTLAYTHFQAAQPTTVGKRATLWLQDLEMDLAQVDFQLSELKLLGCKGATGTAASFMELFGGDEEKAKALEQHIAAKMGFSGCYAVSGQTYSRKVDSFVLNALSGIAQSAHKFSNDIRLLSHLKEFDEPFEDHQIGSSAMPYKRNPMRSERIASLARYVMSDAVNPAFTAAAQWFERTLDDSANRRISIPEAFLATDAILALYINVIKGVRVYPAVINKHLMDELPFMASENILMHCVSQKGGDRQALHEALRAHALAAAQRVKLDGEENDLVERIAGDTRFELTRAEIASLIDPAAFTGRAARQTEEYLDSLAGMLETETEINAGCPAAINV